MTNNHSTAPVIACIPTHYKEVALPNPRSLYERIKVRREILNSLNGQVVLLKDSHQGDNFYKMGILRCNPDDKETYLFESMSRQKIDTLTLHYNNLERLITGNNGSSFVSKFERQ